MSYPVAHVNSVVLVGGKRGRVISGAPKHLVGGSGGGGGGAASISVSEADAMETEDMSPAERRAYYDKKYGAGAGEAIERNDENSPQSDAEDTPASGNNARATPAGCQDLSNSTPDSFQLTRRFKCSDLGPQVYQSGLRHRFPTGNNKNHRGLDRAAIFCNLRHVVVNCVEPFEAWLAREYPTYSFKIGSGYRSDGARSQHAIGEAVDLHLFKNGGRSRLSRKELYDVATKCKNEANIPTTQYLLEYQNGSSMGWIHMACRKSGTKSGGGGIGYMLNGSSGVKVGSWPSRSSI